MAQVLRRDVDRLLQHLKRRSCKTSNLQIHIQNQKRKNKWYKYITWTSLWMWRPIISLEGILENTLSSSAMKASCPLVRTRLASSQTLDVCELAFSLPLFATRYFFRRWGISSIEVVGQATLMASGTEAMGVTGVPFSMTYTTLFLKVRERLVLLDPHLGIHFLIELCCHLYKRETLT